MQEIEVKFRGDGGEKYEGPERRKVNPTKRTVQDRVEDEIREEVKMAIKNFLETGEASTKFTHKSAPADCTDPDDSRDEFVTNAVANIGLELALNATDVDDGEDEE